MTDGLMVALGSSFASGPGIRPVIDRAAARSARNYSHLVAARLGVDLIDGTVAGATTANILTTPQRVGLRRFPPQVELVPAHATLVTITAGGNDLGYLGAVMSTAVVNRMSERALLRPLARHFRRRLGTDDPTADRVENATAGVVDIVQAVRARAPGARLVLVDYLPIFDTASPDIRVDASFAPDELARFRRIATTLSGVLVEAGRRAEAEVIPSSAFAGTDRTVVPQVFGLRPLRQLGSSFHPTAAGMESVARAVLAAL